MINKVILIGNLGQDPEVRHLDSGVAVARFSIATNENYKDRDGNWQTKTEWHNVVAWRNLAEMVERNYKKGNQVFVEGKLTHRKYTGNDGVERNTTEIVANVLRLLEKRDAQTGPSSIPMPTDKDQSYSTSSTPARPADVDKPEVDDDLPF